MYVRYKKCISVMNLPPFVINCHTFSDPLPSSVTYFMDGPLRFSKRVNYASRETIYLLIS